MQPISGKKVIYLVQAVDAVVGSDALLPGFQTEGTWTDENEIVDEQTKQGRIVDYGSDSESFELTLYAAPGDPGQKAIRDAKRNKEKIKVWRVHLDLNANGKHDADFGMAIIESLEMSEPTDGFVEMSVTLPIIGSTQPGELDPLPADLIEAAQYEFEIPGETGTPVTP
jgi:TP901-1 family phage major tail protein